MILPRWQQPSWHGIQAEAEEAKAFPTLPRTYLIHDSASAHTAGIVQTILKLRNVHQTTLEPIGHEDLQIFDTHLARSVRTGILAAYVIWMSAHPDQELSTPAYRILAFQLYTSSWYEYVDTEKLVPEGAISTGTFPSLDGTEDHLVDVKPGRLLVKIPYKPVREEAIAEFKKEHLPVTTTDNQYNITHQIQAQFDKLKEELW